MQIDAVITWVDSSDESWRIKINQCLEKKIDWLNKEESTRFNSINEIEICVHSILKFATYIKNIYLVTDKQQPQNFENLRNKAQKDGVKLELIDHSVIFSGYEEYLPTFNSQSIETVLYKIPNLAEHFVYFNDDFFLINKTKPEDFFKNKFPILRGEWIKVYREDEKNRKNFTPHNFTKIKTAQRIGFLKEIYSFHHTPHPMRKSVIKQYLEYNKGILEQNISYKFRNEKQFILQGLVNHIEIKNKNCYFDKNLSLVYMHNYDWFTILKKTIRADYRKEKDMFMCLQSLETVEEKKLKYLLKWVDKKLDSNFTDEL